MPARPRVGVVIDCDGTLTPKKLGSLFKIVDTLALPPEAEPDFKVLRDRYIPQYHDGKLSLELQIEWLAETFEIYIRHRLTRAAWMQAISQGIEFRRGALETLAALDAVGVPTAIISYGSSDFIEHGLRSRAPGLMTKVYATRMMHDLSGLVTGYDRASFVTQDNKGEWSRTFASAYGIPLENLYAIGDTAGDQHLGHLKKHRLGLAADEAERAKLLPHMGEVAVCDDFEPARAWLASRLDLPL